MEESYQRLNIDFCEIMDRYFILTVTEDAETAIKIAQSVTIIK